MCTGQASDSVFPVQQAVPVATKIRTKVKALVAQSCLTLCNLMDCSLPGSSVHRIFQARVLEWVVISFSRGSSRPRDQTQVFHVAGRYFTIGVGHGHEGPVFNKELHPKASTTTRPDLDGKMKDSELVTR